MQILHISCAMPVICFFFPCGLKCESFKFVTSYAQSPVQFNSYTVVFGRLWFPERWNARRYENVRVSAFIRTQPAPEKRSHDVRRTIRVCISEMKTMRMLKSTFSLCRAHANFSPTPWYCSLRAKNDVRSFSLFISVRAGESTNRHHIVTAISARTFTAHTVCLGYLTHTQTKRTDRVRVVQERTARVRATQT